MIAICAQAAGNHVPAGSAGTALLLIQAWTDSSGASSLFWLVAGRGGAGDLLLVPSVGVSGLLAPTGAIA